MFSRGAGLLLWFMGRFCAHKKHNFIELTPFDPQKSNFQSILTNESRGIVAIDALFLGIFCGKSIWVNHLTLCMSDIAV